MMRSEKGITLIELVIVMAIMALLATISIPLYYGARSEFKASEAVHGLSAIRKALWMYHAEHGQYPVHADTVQCAAPFIVTSPPRDSPRVKRCSRTCSTKAPFSASPCSSTRAEWTGTETLPSGLLPSGGQR